MKRLLLFVTLLAVVFAVPAFAENNTVLKVHVEKATAIPGKILMPGDYVFRMVNPGSSPSVVAISSSDFKTTYGFVPVYSAYRGSGYSNEIREMKSESGLGRIDSWYFPGQRDGFRFIYSKSDVQKAEMFAQQMKAGGTQSGQ